MNILYTIKIEKSDNGYADFIFGKTYGCIHGGCRSGISKEDVIQQLQKIVTEWEEFDSIANRIGDKVTKKNTEFSSFDDSITLTEILLDGSQTKLF